MSIATIAKTKILAHKAKSQYRDRRLWDEAAKLARGSDNLDIEEDLIGSSISIDDIQIVVQNKLEDCKKKRWSYTKSNGQKVVIWEMLEKTLRWVHKFKEIGDVVVQYDPGHAALPWAVVRFFSKLPSAAWIRLVIWQRQLSLSRGLLLSMRKWNVPV